MSYLRTKYVGALNSRHIFTSSGYNIDFSLNLLTDYNIDFSFKFAH